MLTDGYIDRTSVMMMMAGMLLLLVLWTIVAPREYLERKIESAAEHKRHRKKWFHLMDINSTYYNQKIASSKLMRFIVLVFLQHFECQNSVRLLVFDMALLLFS